MTFQLIQDKYEVLEEIAKGGMAQVYKARQLSLGRLVAIKEIKPAFAANPELVERFKREARIAANLVHENIVQVYNFGEPAGGPLFIVMEFVDGLDLKTILGRHGPLPPRLVAIIGREVARALAYAHARGLIHRDVKPGNIMISRRGEVKLMDFGIVREMDSELTRTGAFLGTPSYMSPEQLLGEELSPATDLFSLGIVLYEVLAGQKPFKADSEASLSKKIRTEKEIRLRSLNPQVPRRLQKLVHQCLAKDPRNRPESAEELARRLSRLLGSSGREEDKQELADWMSEGFGVPGEDLSLSAVPLPAPPPIKEARVIRTTSPAEAAPSNPLPAPPPFESSPPPYPPKNPPPPPEHLPKPQTVKPLIIKKVVPPERNQTPDEEPEKQESSSASPVDWFLKWMWRAILLALVLLAALIAFILLDQGNQNLPSDFSPLENLLDKFSK